MSVKGFITNYLFRQKEQPFAKLVLALSFLISIICIRSFKNSSFSVFKRSIKLSVSLVSFPFCWLKIYSINGPYILCFPAIFITNYARFWGLGIDALWFKHVQLWKIGLKNDQLDIGFVRFSLWMCQNTTKLVRNLLAWQFFPQEKTKKKALEFDRGV